MTTPTIGSGSPGPLARADAPSEPRPEETAAGGGAFATLVERALDRHDRQPAPRQEKGTPDRKTSAAHRARPAAAPDAAATAAATATATPDVGGVATPVVTAAATPAPTAPGQGAVPVGGVADATAEHAVPAPALTGAPTPTTAKPQGQPPGQFSGQLSGQLSGNAQAGPPGATEGDDAAPSPTRPASPAPDFSVAPTPTAATPAPPTAPPANLPSVTVGQAGAPTPTATPTTASAAPATAGVAAQVVPEISRLVSRGDGVHRVTLQLNPRALGEVRVVLTVRQGEVHVRLAAGTEARAALAAGQSELTRALDRLGLGEHTIAVAAAGDSQASGRAGDQPRTPTDHSADQQTDQQTGAFAHHETAGGSEHQRETQDHHSWMGADQVATDGVNHPTDTTRVSTSSSAHRSAPAGAVDLRM